MKIDKRNFPSFYRAISQKKFPLSFNKKPELYEGIKQNVDRIVIEGLENIKFITRPVLEAVDFGDQKTITKLLSLRNEVQSGTKCILYKSTQTNTTNTIFSSFERQNDKTVFIIFGWMDLKDSSLPWFTTGFFNHNSVHNEYGIADFSYAGYLPLESVKKFCLSLIELVIQIEIFLQYAEIDEKTLKPNHKQMNGIVCKYENKLPANVTIVDSTWFTTLVKSDAFKVRGHFRLQAHGEGLTKRKLIWIKEFQKEGYTSEAKILNQ